MNACWFCHQELDGETDTHHILPVRLTKTKRGRRVRVHKECHQIWNRTYERAGRLSRDELLAMLRQTKYGNGIFAKERAT